MKKRIQIIRALLTDTSILLCDEPTAALDHDNKVLLMEQLKKISCDCLVIVVTHEVALAELYADRIITMGKGIIESDQIIVSNQLVTKPKIQRHPSLKRTINFVFKSILSRPLESVFMFLMGIALIVSLIASTQLFQNVEDQVFNFKVWNLSANRITTQIHEENIVKREDYYQPNFYYQKHEVFFQSDIDEVIREISEIIAVHASYDQTHILGFDGKEWMEKVFALAPVETLIKEMVLFPLIPAYDPIFMTSKKVNQQIPKMEENSGLVQMIQDFKIENEEAFYRYAYNDLITDMVMYQEATPNVFSFAPYEIVEGYQIPLILGQQPVQDNEVVLTQNTAEYVMKFYKFSSLEACINQEIQVALPMRGPQTFSHTTEMMQYRNLKIVGIMPYSCEEQYQVFFKSQGYRNTFLKDNLLHDEVNIGYTQLEFMLDPQSDANHVLDKIEKSTYYEESDFIRASSDEVVNIKEKYNDTKIFLIYQITILLAIIFVLVVYLFMTRHRRRKETNILNDYGYRVKKILAIKYGINYFLIFIFFLLFGSGLFSWINNFAKAFMFDHLLSFEWTKLLLIIVVCYIVQIGIELVVVGDKND